MKKINFIMKRKIQVSMVFIVLSIFMFSSCDKQDINEETVNETLAFQVIGNYAGTLKNAETNETKSATIAVTLQNDSLIIMHCIAENFDSTITMQLYQNHDSIMVCYSGLDFFNEYGHNPNNYDFCNSQQSGWMNDNWMNDGNYWGNNNNNWGNNNWAGNEQWNAWTNHMNTQHNKNDMHYGGFNPGMNTCQYKFSMNNGNNDYFEIFEGVKK